MALVIHSRAPEDDSASKLRGGDMLADSLALVVSLTLEELDGIQESRKGKARGDIPISDEELAFQLYAEEANPLLACSQDAVFAHSIERALESDRSVLRDYMAAELQAARDREVAIALNDGRPPPSSETLPTAATSSGPLALLMDCMSLESDDEGQPSRTPAPRASSSKVQLPPRPAKPVKRNDCVICADPIVGQEVRAPCGHFYDVACLTDLFRTATVDESLFPPRCCQQPFIFQDIRRFLGVSLARTFELKAREFSTPNRVYCHRPTCSHFLGAATSGPAEMICSRCYTRTCGSCKQQAHTPVPCDTALDQPILALAEQEGWKRCPGCSHLVELAVGCYHMTCRCRRQFCYLCAADWKTCGCPQWEERRLYAAAEQRVERQQPRGNNVVRPAVGDALRQMVQQEAERLRTNHECAHTSWRIRHGAGRCESCNYMISLQRCLGCQMLACVRCRRNRL